MSRPSHFQTLRAIPVLLTVCVFAFPANAKYSGGTGEPNDPYQIATAADLIALGETPDDYDKHFKLMADVDLSGFSYDSAPIAPDKRPTEWGFRGTAFTGVFDGNGHAISHLTVSGAKTLGLFGYIGEGGRVGNLGVEDVTIAGGDFSRELGGLAGRNEGEITQCYATGSVTGGADAADLGGLAGYNLGGTVANCFAACTVAAGAALQDEPKHIGGLVGWNDWGVVTNCHATGDVIAGNESAGIGGLVGCNEQGTITDCHATGTVTGGDDSESLGGLVGENGDEVDIGVIADCYASGDVIGGNAAESLGGLVGSNDAAVSGCYAAGAVIATDFCSRLGGLVGDNDGGNVTCCFAVGDVTAGNSSERTGGFAGTNGGEGTIRESYAAGSIRAGSDSHCLGGLVGENEGGEEAAYVRNCYSTANVTAGARSGEIGGLVGKNDGGDDPGSVRNCYSTGAVMAGANSGAIGGLVGGNIGHIRGSFWDTETSGLNTMCGRQDTHAHDCDNANGKTTAEMQTAKMFLDAGWDFVCEVANGTEDIWHMPEGDYPRLVWELEGMPLCPAEVIELDAANFDQTIAQGVVLVDFYATWCSHCRTQASILDEVAEQVRGEAVVAKLDVDQTRSIAQRYGVTAIPTLIIFKNGEVFERFVGVTQAPVLTAAIRAAIAHQEPGG